MFGNSKLSNATDPLIAMRSVDTGPNAQVAVKQPIPNFPIDADAVSQLNCTLPLPIIYFQASLN